MESQQDLIATVLENSGAGANLVGGLLSRLSKGADNEQEFMEIENSVEADLFDIDRRLSDRLYGWMPWGWDQSLKNNCYASCFGVILLIVLYSLGLGGFVLLNQRILACEQGLLAPNMNASCKGLADSCKMGNNDFTNFRLYVQFRLVAFIFLLIPFLYIPFMTVLDISTTAKKIYETLGFRKHDPNHESRGEKFQKKVKQGREDTFATFGGKRSFIFEATVQSILHLSPTGHEKMLLTLFFLCHVFLGGFSITFDVFAMQLGQEARCLELKKSLSLMGQNDIALTIEGVAIYNFILGIVFFLLTFIYIFYQWGNTLQKQVARRQKKRENLEREQERVVKIRNASRELHGIKAGHERNFKQLLQKKEDEALKRSHREAVEQLKQQNEAKLRQMEAGGRRTRRTTSARGRRTDVSSENDSESESDDE